MPKVRNGIKPLVKIEREYELALRRLMNQTYAGPLGRVVAGNYDPDTLQRTIAVINRRAETDPNFGREQADRAINQMEAYQRKRFDAVVRSVSVDLTLFGAGADQTIVPMLETALERNVGLIKRLAEDYGSYASTQVAEIIKETGFDLATQQKQLEDFFARGGPADRRMRNRARLVTRDQNNKIIGDLNRARHQSVGGTRYVWKSVLDIRVRDNHEHLNGSEQSWNEPPLGGGTSALESGNPGSGIQCRCFAKFIFEDDPVPVDKPPEPFAYKANDKIYDPDLNDPQKQGVISEVLNKNYGVSFWEGEPPSHSAVVAKVSKKRNVRAKMYNMANAQLSRYRHALPETRKPQGIHIIPRARNGSSRVDAFKYKEGGKMHEVHGFSWSVTKEISLSDGLPATRQSKLQLGKGEFKVQSESLMATFNHEYGHAVHDVMRGHSGVTPDVQGARMWTKIFKQKNSSMAGKMDMRNNVSGYASSNEAELFAESFAAYVHRDYGKPGTPTLPESIHKFMSERVFGGNGNLIERNY